MEIIVVDDEINSLHMFLDHIIGKENIKYSFFKDDVPSILAYVKNNDVSGAFLDINMPNIGGFDLSSKIIKLVPNIKIVFITGLNITLDDVPKEIKKNVLGIIYKPVNQIELDKYIVKMNDKVSILKVKTFNGFDCFINNRLVMFSSNKSKELFAYLIVNRGKSVSMDMAITALWPDKNIDKAKISYRDAVWRLRQTLDEISFPCVVFSRAMLSLNLNNIECDYYDVIDGKERFNEDDQFLPSYEWSLSYENEMYFLKK